MNLDFNARSPRPGPVSWLIFALGLAAAGWVMQAWQAADAARMDAETRLASLQDKPVLKTPQTAAKVKRIDTAALARQSVDDAARRQLSLPWARLLETLQTLRPPEIAFLNLDVDGRRGDFTLAAQARNHAAMLDYFHALQGAPGLAQVSLSRHELREADGLLVVSFSLRGEWTQP